VSKAVHLLTENTPNGKKVQILLEELRAEYGFGWETHLIDLDTEEQKKDWFLALNPNGLPAPFQLLLISSLTLAQEEYRSYSTTPKTRRFR
jgi:hypothetical protein